ncbi:MAG: hypothetical protein HC889_13935 [Synechococcaceae cyanobacterium SM1_2_3]|nr:hypothetical protein [Synechococcaceae cyanobacterium SM1_2_3]
MTKSRQGVRCADLRLRIRRNRDPRQPKPRQQHGYTDAVYESRCPLPPEAAQ